MENIYIALYNKKLELIEAYPCEEDCNGELNIEVLQKTGFYFQQSENNYVVIDMSFNFSEKGLIKIHNDVKEFLRIDKLNVLLER